MVVGGALQQREGDHWEPLAYFSRSLSKTEQKFNTFGRELVANFLSIRYSHHYLEGRAFSVFTGHANSVATPASSTSPVPAK